LEDFFNSLLVLKHSRMLLERGSIVILSADALAEITSTVDNK
jgi:hypothetical protein